jgi:hypothetical protein
MLFAGLIFTILFLCYYVVFESNLLLLHHGKGFRGQDFLVALLCLTSKSTITQKTRAAETTYNTCPNPRYTAENA